MKKVLFTLISLISTIAYSQEEFYGNHNGLSFAGHYGKILKSSVDTRGAGVNIYFRKGFDIGFGYNNYSNEQVSNINLGYLTNASKLDPFPTKLYAGLSYSHSEISKADLHLVGANLGLFKILYAQSNFPFSLSLATSFFIGFKKSDNVPFSDKKETIMTTTGSFGVAYTQAFFSKNSI